MLDEGEEFRNVGLPLGEAVEVGADELEEEAFAGCQGAGMGCRGVSYIGQGDGSVWSLFPSGECGGLEVEFEVVQVGHGYGCRGCCGDAPTVGTLERGDSL